MIDAPRIQTIEVIDSDTGQVIYTCIGVNAQRNAEKIMDSRQHDTHRLHHLRQVRV